MYYKGCATKVSRGSRISWHVGWGEAPSRLLESAVSVDSIIIVIMQQSKKGERHGADYVDYVLEHDGNESS